MNRLTIAVLGRDRVTARLKWAINALPSDE